VPKWPILPRRQTDLTTAALSGLVLAVGLVFLFEYFDNRIKSPQELRAHLGLSFLGMVPAIDASGPSLVSGAVPPHFAEAIRNVRTNVLFSSADEGVPHDRRDQRGPRRRQEPVLGEPVGVARAGRASACCTSMQTCGARACTRSSSSRRSRPLEPARRRLQAERAVRKVTGVPGLAVLPGRHDSAEPGELLGSKRFDEYFATLSEHFDYVIIDSPPVLAVADASILANTASGVVFVVGATRPAVTPRARPSTSCTRYRRT
jgi:hypothetical protein